VAYGARLESGFTRKSIEGSNPSPSARFCYQAESLVIKSGGRRIRTTESRVRTGLSGAGIYSEQREPCKRSASHPFRHIYPTD